MNTDFLFRKVDAAPLAVFRILMGILMACEGFGAILTGWVTNNFVTPGFTFNFIGLDFLQVIVGPQAYVIYAGLGFFGIGIALGYRYRAMVVGYSILWAAVYFGQKTSYNNHYYLLLLLCFLFFIVPAHHYVSVDARSGRIASSETVPYWTKFVFKFLLLIVYLYAAFAKIYPDWLSGRTVALFLSSKSDLLGPLSTQEWFIMLVSYGGIFFDMLVIPALWYKPTRKAAFVVSIFFHLFNSIVFQIGIFPYMMLITSVLYFDEALIRKIFFRNRISEPPTGYSLPNGRKKTTLFMVLSIFFVLQFLLPLRPHFYPGSSHWTEEGHRLSWHMMLRSKSGIVTFSAKDETTGLNERIFPERVMPAKMARTMGTRPDMIWQYAQRLQEEFSLKGHPNVQIFVKSSVSLNGRPYQPMIDPSVDLAAEPWSHFESHQWILPHPDL